MEAELESESVAAARLALFELYARRGASVWVGATGVSMRPWIRPGASILVAFGEREAKLGEVAVFARGTRIVAHRVIGCERVGERLMLTTKGDASAGPDPSLRSDELLGVVRAMRPGPGGRQVEWMLSGHRAVAIARVSALLGRLNPALRAAGRILRARGRRRIRPRA